MATVHVLGIRHHGPGSARLVERALNEVKPTCILIEGPPELTDVLGYAGQVEMEPPVAGFVYATERPELASFDPFASFSPEWVALRYGLANAATVRFIDLPVSNDLALRAAAIDAAMQAEHDEHQQDETQEDETEDEPADQPAHEADGLSLGLKARIDPIGLLAELAGAGDPEQWWEDVVEHQSPNHDALAPFAAILQAMTELRSAADADSISGVATDAEPNPAFAAPLHRILDSVREQRREAAMRQAIRAAEKEGFATIVIVCGAWHAPVLHPASFPSAAADAELLKGLPKIKVTATWTPWTHRLLAKSSGYGAGITAPGWYHHVFTHSNQGPRRLVSSWLVNVARALRAEKHDASPASVIESVRLAETLASLRGRPLAGLQEVNDASQTVLCAGSDARFSLVAETVLMDQGLGAVPADTPQVPLAKDFATTIKQLRVKQSALAESVEVDLRTPSGLERSRLFYRLQLIGIGWAQPSSNQTRSTGTFKETWSTEWKPELEIAFVEASRFGTTIAGAAAGSAIEQSEHAELPQLTELLDQVLRGSVTEAIDSVLGAVGTRAAESHDVAVLLDAVPPLARIARYGDVRKTDTEAVGTVLDGIITRICASLPGATSQLDDDAAKLLRTRINAMHNALGSVDDPIQRARWHEALLRIHRAAQRHGDAVHGTVAGRACRLLRDGGQIDSYDAYSSLSRVLSIGTDAAIGARWIDGFFAGGGLVLLHDVGLLDMLDSWMETVPSDTFDDVLPLLRRTFGSFVEAERRMIGSAIHTRSAHKATPATQSVDTMSGFQVGFQAVTPTVLALLGIKL